MYKKKSNIKINRDRAVQIAADHNCVPVEVAQRYTDSELREVLRHLKLTPNF